MLNYIRIIIGVFLPVVLSVLFFGVLPVVGATFVVLWLVGAV